MPRTTCSLCGTDHPVAYHCCPYCAVMDAELEMLKEDAEVDHPGSRWDCSDLGSTLTPDEASLRRTAALVLLLIASLSSWLAIESLKSRPGTFGLPDETGFATSPSELSRMPSIALVQRRENVPTPDRTRQPNRLTFDVKVNGEGVTGPRLPRFRTSPSSDLLFDSGHPQE